MDFVSQAEYAATIYPDATNSIRIITAQRKNGDYEVLLAFHRFGTDQSRPVDNISSGGLCALINVETGVIGTAMTKIEPGKAVPVHPDTQSQIEGGAVPNWGELKRKLLQVHRCFPYYVFFAWDIVIDENGEPTALEINRGSDLGIQMIQPQRHEKLGAFMREYGLLEKW